MSIEAHPNINAAGLTADIVKAFMTRLRGPAADGPFVEAYALVRERIAEFVVDISMELDKRFGDSVDNDGPG